MLGHLSAPAVGAAFPLSRRQRQRADAAAGAAVAAAVAACLGWRRRPNTRAARSPAAGDMAAPVTPAVAHSTPAETAGSDRPHAANNPNRERQPAPLMTPSSAILHPISTRQFPAANSSRWRVSKHAASSRVSPAKHRSQPLEEWRLFVWTGHD